MTERKNSICRHFPFRLSSRIRPTT